MDDALERALFDNYPTVYTYTTEDAAIEAFETPPAIAYDGIQCDDGWVTIIDQLSNTLEELNTDEDTERQVRAVQVKEKFGGLRFYTDQRTEAASQAIDLVKGLSRGTCERCGTTSGAQRIQHGSWYKVLCEPCALDWKEITPPIEIWRFEMDCHQCGEETPVVYPRSVGGQHGGTWETVGPILAEKQYCKVKRTFSNVQEQYVWGNHCRICDAYQGNYYVYEAADEYTTQVNGWYPVADFDCIDRIDWTG